MKLTLRSALGVVAAGALLVAGAVAINAPVATAAQTSDPGPANSVPSAVPAAFTPSVDNGQVNRLAQIGSTIAIGGTFTSVNSQTRNYFAAFNKNTGALSSIAPNFNNSVNVVLPGTAPNSVYVGGQFTQVNGQPAQFLTEIDLGTGNPVPGFTAPKFNYGYVNDLVMSGNRLYVAGTFTVVGGKAHAGLVSLNATTGALDPFVNVQFSGHHNDSGSGAQGWIGPWDEAISPDGKYLVAIGDFKYADGQLRDQVAMLDLTGSSETLAPWATAGYQPLCFSWAFDGYVRGVAFSPDGSYFVVNATGGGNPGTLCDATSRFATDPTNANATPTWVDETGGDTVWGVTITSTAIFIGGHNRWNNNPLGVDHALAGAVPRPGMAALDPISGRPLAWNPGKNPLGAATYTILATTDGLWIGYDTLWIGNYQYKRARVAFFPWTGGYHPAATTTAGLPGNAYVAGSFGTSTSNVLYRVNAAGPAIQALDNGPNWAADTTDPSPYRNSQSNIATYTNQIAETPNVPASTPNAIFDTERWSPTDTPPMTWQFPATAGMDVQVRLYFANNYSGTSSPGQRVFNVAIDGSTVLSNYDIVADVGNQTGTMKSFNVVSPGTITITFTHVTENPLINGIELVNLDAPTPPPGVNDTLSKVAFTGTSASGGSVSNQGIDFGNWRGAFMVGNQVFYGYTDGYFYSRTFDGTTFGPAVKIDPYHDPVWDGVPTHDNNTTFDGAFPTIYGQIPNITGMTYNQGRLYYTLFNDSHLYSRWFNPDAGIIDETTVTSTSSVDFSDADGMFVVGNTMYYADKLTGNLYSVAFSNGTVSGTPTLVSGPLKDGVNWTGRALFLAPGAPVNQPPVASFTSNCTGLSCTFDASGSGDPDGTIASYAWDFGDSSQAGTGVKPTHAYAGSGTYQVKLTVTDNQGAQTSVTNPVTVTQPVSGIGFVGASDSGGGKAVKSITAALPSGSAAGNTALMFLTRQTANPWSAPAGITGWTSVGSYANSTLTTQVWEKNVAAGDLGGSVTFTSTTYDHAALTLAVYSGVNATTPIGPMAQSLDTRASSHVTPAISATTGEWVISFWADRSTATRTYTVPAAVTTRDASPDSGTLTMQSVVADSNGPVSGGSYGGLTATTDAATDRSVAWTIALNGA